MAFPTDMPPSTPPTYFIYRDGDPGDATAPPVFFPAKDSDELFDALRAKYPHVKSHSDRMRDAIIEFLIEERDAESYNNISPTVPSLYDSSMTASPWQQSWPSMSSTCQTSPELENLMTPTSGGSPNPQPQMTRQPSTAEASSTASPPAIDQMTSVFSLSTSEQPKQRVRRKMTEAEKVDYRKRRIVKACDKCSKRKRKCNHNTLDAEISTSASNANPEASQKVKKQRNNRKIAGSTWPFMPSAEVEAGEDFEALKHHPPAGYFAANELEDLTTLLDEPIPDIVFDEFTDFSQQQSMTSFDQYNNDLMTIDPSLSQWPWSDGQDWTLMDPVSGDAFTPSFANGNMLDEMSAITFPHNSTESSQQTIASDGCWTPSHQQYQRDQLAVNANASASCHDGQGRHGQLTASGSYSSTAESQVASPVQRQTSGRTMLWEHLRTGQQCVGGGTFVIGKADSGDVVESGNVRLGAGKISLARTVLCLVGTARAARAFSSLLSSRSSLSPRLPSGQVGVHEGEARPRLASRQDLAATGKMAARPPNGIENRREKVVFANTLERSELANANTVAPVLPSSTIAKLDLHAGSFAVVGNPPGVPPRRATPQAASLPHGTLSLTSALSATWSPFDEEEPEVPQHKDHALLEPSQIRDLSARIAKEAPRFKRRIPKALHSVVDRDNEIANSSGDGVLRHFFGTRANGGAHLQLFPVRSCATLLANRSVSTNAFATPTATTAALAAPVPAQHAHILQVTARDETQHKSEDVPETRWKPTWNDTKRYRDHHGRAHFFACSDLAWLTATALFVALATFTAGWSSIVPLALLCLQPALMSLLDWSAGKRIESAVRCSLRNSAWLNGSLSGKRKARSMQSAWVKQHCRKETWAMDVRRVVLIGSGLVC